MRTSGLLARSGGCLLLVLGSLTAQFCLAQTATPSAWPNRPIRVVVPYPAGGYYDLVARVIGNKFPDALGQPAVVENRVGANAIVGTEFTAKSAPDGYTIMVGGIGPHAINPGLYPKLPYDAQRDFLPLVHVANQPTILVVPASDPARTLRELLESARTRPGQISFASNGSGSTPHLAAEMMASATGVKFNHVPFKGSAPAVTAVLGSQVNLLFGTASDVMSHVQAGKLRALAVTSPRRLPALPELPTAAEAGVSGYEASAWFAYFAPAGVPREIVLRLNGEINRIMEQPDVRDRLTAQGTTVLVGGSPEQLAGYQRSEIIKWARVVKESGARAD